MPKEMSYTSKLLIPISILLFVAVVFLSAKLEKAHGDLDSSNSVNRELSDELSYKTNQNGLLISEKNAALAKAENIEEFYKNEVAEIKEEFDVKLKNLQSYLSAEIQSVGSGSGVITDTVIINKDKPVPARKLTVREKWLTFDATIVQDDFTYSYVTRDSLTFVTSFRRDGWFGKKELIVNGTSYNPNAKITGLRNIQVEDYRERRFGVGPVIVYDPFAGEVRPGIGISYDLIRF